MADRVITREERIYWAEYRKHPDYAWARADTDELLLLVRAQNAAEAELGHAYARFGAMSDFTQRKLRAARRAMQATDAHMDASKARRNAMERDVERITGFDSQGNPVPSELVPA